MENVLLKGKLTKKNEEEVGVEHCPLCQVPLCLLAKDSQHQHVLACVNMCSAGLPGLVFTRMYEIVNFSLIIVLAIVDVKLTSYIQNISNFYMCLVSQTNN